MDALSSPTPANDSAEVGLCAAEDDPLEPACLPRFSWAALSLSGKKKELNDDAFLLFSASPKGMQLLEDKGESGLEEADLFFGVSDGMGGGKAGNIASSLLLDELSRVIPNTFHAAATGFRPDYSEYLEETLKYVHHGINECAEVHPEWEGMSATLTLTWFTPANLYFANVGDSRLYLCRDGKVKQLSQDHTFAWQQWKRAQITEFEYRKHPRRCSLYEVIGGGHPFISPYVSSLPYQKGDRFLLCTDGLIDGLWERHFKEYLTQSLFAPEDIVKHLAEHAMSAHNQDDKTLIIIDIL